MLVLEGDDPELYARIQERNLIRQYDLLTNSIEIGLKHGPTALDKYTLWSLNHVAVAHISQYGGRFREEPIYVGNHVPPHFNCNCPSGFVRVHGNPLWQARRACDKPSLHPVFCWKRRLPHPVHRH